RDEAYLEEKRMMEPAADRVERLRQLGNALREARCKLDEWRHHVICGVLFEEWCKARGIPDFTDRHVAIFDDAVADLIAGRLSGTSRVSRGRATTSETRAGGRDRRSAARLHHQSRVRVSKHHGTARRGRTWTVCPICYEILGSGGTPNPGAKRHQSYQSCKKA